MSQIPKRLRLPRWLVIAALVRLASVAPVAGEAGPVVFSVMADIPYTEEEAAVLPGQIAELDPRSAFAVHLGDIKGRGGECGEGVYSWMADVLSQAAMPAFILPGDNEWNDCPDPDAAWELWTRHLLRLEGKWSHDLRVERQRERPENFAFVPLPVRPTPAATSGFAAVSGTLGRSPGGLESLWRNGE